MQLEPTDSHALSDRLLRAARGHRQALHTLALLLVELVDGRHDRALGYASLGEYAAKVLDLPPRQVKDLLRIGRALPRLPKVAAAMQAGALDWTKVRELVRVATPETEAEWVTRAGERTSRVLEQEVARSLRGSLPPETGEPQRTPARGGVLFQMEAVDRAVVFDGIAVFRARTGVSTAEVEDGAILAAMARFVIAHAEATMTPVEVSTATPGASTESTDERSPEPEGPTPVMAAGAPTGERYQIVLDQCPGCAATTSGGAEVSDTIATEAACDAEIVDMRPGPEQGHATRAVPPATRRKALHRAGGCCEVPGCGNHLWLDVHHIWEWARGGRHGMWNLVVLCSTHHRAAHAGCLAIERLSTGAVQVTHGDGRVFVGRVPRAHVGRAGPGRTAA
jgi:hypothetical protein